MVQNSQGSRQKYWATYSSICSFVCTTHSFACSALHASLARSAAITRLLACSLRSLPRSWESELLKFQNGLNLPHSAMATKSHRKRQKDRREADETLRDLDLDDSVLDDLDCDDLDLALEEEERLRKEEMMMIMAFERGYLGRKNVCVPFQF